MKQIDMRKLIIGLELVALIVLKSIGAAQEDVSTKPAGVAVARKTDHHLKINNHNSHEDQTTR